MKFSLFSVVLDPDLKNNSVYTVHIQSIVYSKLNFATTAILCWKIDCRI